MWLRCYNGWYGIGRGVFVNICIENVVWKIFIGIEVFVGWVYVCVLL